MANYTIGVDLGQSRDYTAVAIVERLQAWTGRIGVDWWGHQSHDTDDHFHVVHLERFQLGTPYYAIVESIGELVTSEALKDQNALVLDATGVGRGIVDMFNEAFHQGQLGSEWPIPITITGGERAKGRNVPKRDLVSRLQALLEQSRLQVPASLTLGDALKKELLAFRAKITKSGQTGFEAARERDHDDIVLAVALACWLRHDVSMPRAIARDGQICEPHEFPRGGDAETDPART